MKIITYTECNGIYYPNLELPAQINYLLGKYANLRLEFIKKHRRGTYTTLLTEGRLNEYLHAIDVQAHNPLQWAAEMNNIKASAEEIVLQEVIYQ